VNPIQDLFNDIEKIIDFMEVKDLNEATKYETPEIRNDSELWMGAMMESDTYLTYRSYWNNSMFQEVLPNVKFNNIRLWMEKPHNIPVDFRDNLLKRGRNTFLDSYVERNTYYRMLNGLPSIETPSSEYIYLSEPLRNHLSADDIPVHELSLLVQNRYVSTEEYREVLKDNPDKPYLKYLGIYKIDLFTARKAKDFELIRFLPMSRSDINPHLLKEFGSLYNEYREYVMAVLYNRHLENIYENYRTFMGVLITSFVLMQISNKAAESATDRKFLDDAVLHIILSMHGIPRSLLMTNEVRRNLVINLLKLTREKATDDVYYSLIQILGYHDVVISKLMLMRGQQFDKDSGQATFADSTELNDFSDVDKITSIDPDTNELVQKLNVDPYFVAVDLKDPNPYDTITSGKAPIYSYESVTDPDPTWWDLADTQDLLKNTHYTIADSKYIMAEVIIHQINYLFESIYFTRLILDNKEYTDTFTITIPEIFGTDQVSIYDLMVFILAATCMNNGLSGNIITSDEGLFATAGFNFDIDLTIFQTFLNNTKYVDRDRIMLFMENLSMRTPSDINRLFNEVMYPMREWLQTKISQSVDRYEFLEYEAIYRALFTYDIAKNSFLEDFKPPMKIIEEKHGISSEDMQVYQHFYPRHFSGEAIKTDEMSSNPSYFPFTNVPVTWHIDVPYKGTLYFHDILNSPDIRDLKSDDNYIFMDSDGDELIVDRDALRDVLEAINRLSDDEVREACFRVNTPILNSSGGMIPKETRLPANIRSTGIFKQILIDKILMDIDGLAIPPVTYLEYLYRKNPKLHELLTVNDRFERDKELWMQDVMTIVLALETELNMHMKYFEQSIVGSEMLFKPLITLIKHFKSTYVNFAKTGLRYVFGDKIDAGGTSNMLKLFDSMSMVIHFVLFSRKGEHTEFGLYDTEHKTKHKIVMKDRSGLSINDEVRFLKNKKEII